MMYLPKFDNKNITAQELLAEATRLHSQADNMLATTSIADIFAKYGKLQPIGGSYSYDLMVYPDLDMYLIADNVTREDLGKLTSEILETSFVRKISVVNNVDFTSSRPGMPKGYWIGIEIPFENDRWGIDLWFQTKEWTDDFDNTYDHYKEKLENLTNKQKEEILLIKYHLIRIGEYTKLGFMSTDVYDAVLSGNTHLFDKYINKKN